MIWSAMHVQKLLTPVATGGIVVMWLPGFNVTTTPIIPTNAGTVHTPKSTFTTPDSLSFSIMKCVKVIILNQGGIAIYDWV